MNKDVELLKFNDLSVMPWKNGRGLTHELTIYPKNATLSSLNFTYRISMALIKGENEFSIFPGYERILTVVKGEGIKVNEKTLVKNEVIQFQGQESIVASLLNSNSEVIDLGVIYNPRMVNIKFERIKIAENIHIQNNTQDSTFLIFLDGEFYFRNERLNNLDTLKILTELNIQLTNEVNFIKITIQNK